MSIDVEEYFHGSVLSGLVSPEQAAHWPSRVDAPTRLILDLFDAAAIQATFFVLGAVAVRYPGLVREIARRGHEVASHGFAHELVIGQGPQAFREDVVRTRLQLEDLVGAAVTGYRAPSFSIGCRTWWAYDVLIEAGYAYSSSINPVHRRYYGLTGVPRFPIMVEGLPLIELPISTIDIGGRLLPSGGGGYFRALPYAASRWSIQRVNRRDARPAIFYFHPWELDKGQPRLRLRGLARLRRYLNLEATAAKLLRLGADFSWCRADALCASLRSDESALPKWAPRDIAARSCWPAPDGKEEPA